MNESTRELISKMLKVQPSDVDDSFLNLTYEVEAGGVPMYLTSIING